MRCLVLGAAGFIGSHLTDALVAGGHSVRALVKPSTNMRNIEPRLDRIDLRRGDILREADLASALVGVEIVFHLAATTLPSSSNENMVYDVETNVVGTLKLLNEARRASTRKIVFLSSGGTVYGVPRSLPVTEGHSTDPLCSYGITKLACEKYLALYGYLHRLGYTVLRVSNVFGPRQNPNSGQGAIAAFLAKLSRNQPVTIWGDGSVARDFIYIDDVVRALLRVMEGVTSSPVYNIGSGAHHSLNAVLEVIAAVTGLPPSATYSAPRSVDVPLNWLDISLARKELDWRPTVGLHEGIARMWAAMRAVATVSARPR